jgi:hypothetical protein
MGQTGSRSAWRGLLALAATLALLLPVPLAPFPDRPSAGAHHAGIMLPFEAGAEWFVSQGYNTSPDEGWSHYNCDPKTGKDEISQSSRCDDGWQYKYSFDLRRVDGEEAGQPVLSPASGVVRWIDPPTAASRSTSVTATRSPFPMSIWPGASPSATSCAPANGSAT